MDTTATAPTASQDQNTPEFFNPFDHLDELPDDMSIDEYHYNVGRYDQLLEMMNYLIDIANKHQEVGETEKFQMHAISYAIVMLHKKFGPRIKPEEPPASEQAIGQNKSEQATDAQQPQESAN